jgi:hypothetical protein
MEGRSIDALRELGRFDEAEARLAKVPLAALEPQSKDAPAQAKVKRDWVIFFQQLKVAIARKDSSIEPFDMIPHSVALGYCIDRASTLDDGQRAFCTKEQADVDQLRAERARAEQEMKALSQPRDASGR